MSLYSAGLKSQKTRVRVGDSPRGNVEPFTYPPKNTHDALMAQKAYLMSKNGYAFTDKSFKDLPFTNIGDAWQIWRFWDELAPKDNRTNAMKNSLLRAKAPIVKSASAYLGIPYAVQPSLDTRTKAQKDNDNVRIANLLGMKDAIIRMSPENTKEFWKGLYFFESAFRNQSPSPDKLGMAWDALVEATDELPGRVRDFGKFVADTVVRPIADAAGTGVGAFFDGLFGGLKTPIGIAGMAITGYLGYNYFKNRKGPAVVINRKKG